MRGAPSSKPEAIRCSGRKTLGELMSGFANCVPGLTHSPGHIARALPDELKVRVAVGRHRGPVGETAKQLRRVQQPLTSA